MMDVLSKKVVDWTGGDLAIFLLVLWVLKTIVVNWQWIPGVYLVLRRRRFVSALLEQARTNGKPPCDVCKLPSIMSLQDEAGFRSMCFEHFQEFIYEKYGRTEQATAILDKLRRSMDEAKAH